MKKKIYNIGIILGLFTALILNGCKEEIDPVVEELNFNRTFTPVGFNSQISNVTTVKLTWAPVKNVDHYVVEIYQGTDFSVAGAMLYTVDIPAPASLTDDISITYVLPAGSTLYSARLKAVSSLTGIEDSKWASVEFTTGPENLFTGYKSEMTAYQACTVRWKPGSAATALLFIAGTSQTSYPLTPGEIVAGEKMLTGVPSARYEVRLMNSTFSRGTMNLTLEGDVLLNPGDDLAAAITALPAGGVIILPDGATYSLAGSTLINKGIKIRAITNVNPPVIYPATGASATGPMLLIDPALTANDSIVFQNVNITGFINNDISGASGMVTGVFDQGTANPCNIGTLKFKGCKLTHFNRQLIRLRGTAVQVVNNFLVDNCILFDYGTNSTSYGIISSSNASATINNIKFSNSTIYNFLSYLILYTSGSACNSVVVENCSLNQITYTTGSTSRYIIDLNNTVLGGSGITISNCIFGSTAPLNTNGVRTTSGTLTITGSYCTSDFIDNGVVANAAYSIMSRLALYSGLSTALWSDPVNGVFTFLDGSFAGRLTAGDPRWR